MNVVIFGSTGMIGAGVLIECLEAPGVESVLVVNRTPLGRTHPKLREVLLADFFAPGSLRDACAGIDACFFCLGVTSVGLDEPAYTRLTYDLTIGVARAIVSPRMTMCYVSGAGTDSTERGSAMWARVKGRTENALLAMPFRAAYMFRPGFVQPMKGVRSKTGWYQAIYSITAPLFPLVHRFFPRATTTTVEIGQAMLRAAEVGSSRTILGSGDISALAAECRT
jgi:uncharacterized protein YbjT (DUF2867 family)